MRYSDRQLILHATLSLAFILVLGGVIFFLSQPQHLTVLGASTQIK